MGDRKPLSPISAYGNEKFAVCSAVLFAIIQSVSFGGVFINCPFSSVYTNRFIKPNSIIIILLLKVSKDNFVINLTKK